MWSLDLTSDPVTSTEMELSRLWMQATLDAKPIWLGPLSLSLQELLGDLSYMAGESDNHVLAASVMSTCLTPLQ